MNPVHFQASSAAYAITYAFLWAGLLSLLAASGLCLALALSL